MAKYNVELLKKIAKKEGLKLKLNYFENDSQRIYDFDVIGNTNVRRFKIVTFKTDTRLFPDTANVYVGTSAKYGIQFNSHEELIKKIKNFKRK